MGARTGGGLGGLTALAIVIWVIVSLSHSGASNNSAAVNTTEGRPGTTDIPLATDTPLPTATPASTEAVGQSVRTTTGAIIVVEKIAPASSGDEFETQPPGGAFLGAEVRECAGNQTLFVSPVAWSVKLADSTQVDATAAVEMTPAPSLESTNLNPGGCTDGWVYFPLPAGSQPVQINLLKADFYWTL